MEEIKLSGNNKLPKEYIVKCDNAGETNAVNHYFYKMTYMLSHWRYLICAKGATQSDGQPNGKSISGSIGDEFLHLPVFTFEEWQKLITPKEPEFTLPEKWIIKITEKNRRILSDWRLSTSNPSGGVLDDDYGYLANICDDWTGYWFSTIEDDYTEITFSQFKQYVLKQTNEVMSKECEIEEFKVPERWYINGSREFHEWLISTNKYNICNVSGEYREDSYTLPNADFTQWKYISGSEVSGSTKITFEQFNKYIYKSKTINEMKEFAISGSTTLKEAFVKEAGVSMYSKESASRYVNLVPGSEHNQVQGNDSSNPEISFKVFVLPMQWDEGLAYVKEYYNPKLQPKVLYFGKLKCTIENGADFATTEYGNISKAEIQKVLKLFGAKMSICGYDLKIENVDDIVVAFGCQSGTIREAKVILEAFNTK